MVLKPAFAHRIVWVLLLSLVTSAATAQADESYYLIMFGQQGGPLQLELSHTFATFVKATGDGLDKSKYRIESQTISWLPQTLEVKAARRPEEGVNLDLISSLRQAKAIKAEVALWGAFAIQKELYERASRQVARLKKGDIDYKVLDLRFRPDKASNCMHAVCDIDMDNGLLTTGTAHGNDASYLVLKHFTRWIINPDQTHEWINERLELGKDIPRRDFTPKATEKR